MLVGSASVGDWGKICVRQFYSGVNLALVVLCTCVVVVHEHEEEQCCLHTSQIVEKNQGK